MLLVTIDTLRADHVGLYGYARPTTPRIDAWFREGRVFERAYSTEANTSPSIASVLTGLLPQEHGVRLLHQLLPERNRLLPDLLPARFQTAAVVSNSVLADEAMGMGRRFDHYDDFVDESEPYRRVFERSAEKTTEAAIRWLQEERVPGQPVFLWVHYIDPHGPYHPPPTWPRSFTHATPVPIDVTRLHAYQREPGVTDGLAYVDAYDEEIAYLDASLGRLLDVWASTMEPSRSLAILTADHGESMMEHERWFTHGYHVYEEIVRVPLLMRGAGVPPGRSRMLASGIDVAPTILRFAGVPVPANLRGEDLRAAPDTPSMRAHGVRRRDVGQLPVAGGDPRRPEDDGAPPPRPADGARAPPLRPDERPRRGDAGRVAGGRRRRCGAPRALRERPGSRRPAAGPRAGDRAHGTEGRPAREPGGVGAPAIARLRSVARARVADQRPPGLQSIGRGA